MKQDRNDPCPCGSGKKFKNCCGRDQQAARSPQTMNSPMVRVGDAPVPLAEAIELATRLQTAGELQRAEDIYRSVIAVQPHQPDALHLLGVVMLQCNNPEAAIDLIGQAIAHRPGTAMYHNNLGKAHRSQERFEEALAQYRRALELEPNMVEALYNSGEALRWLGDLDGAITMLEKAVAVRPQFADAHFQLGNALLIRGRPGEAAMRYQMVIQLDPKQVSAYKELAVSLYQQGKPREAIAQFQKALSLRPDDPCTWSELANAYLSLGELDESESCQRHALQLDASLPEAHENLGNVLKSKGRVEMAISCYRRAIELDPHNARAHSNLLLCLNYLIDCSSESILEEHKRWGQAHSLPADFEHGNDMNPERRLRIGYVSPDLRTHAVAYFVEPLLKHHDPDQFEIICYAEVTRPDKVTERMKNYAHKWRSTCGWADRQLIDVIRSDGIDILVDLAGHTSGSRLVAFTAKPAPMQVSYIGYVNTTGLSTIDYRITDELTDPPADQIFYTEKLVYLKNGFSCYAPPPIAPEISPLPSSKAGYATFASFSNLFKINDSVIDLWCHVLHANPASRMRIFRHLLKGGVKEELYQAFAMRGIDSSRIDLWCEIPQKYLHLPPGLQHLGLYEDIDVTLDTFPWNGHTISCESLWMGVPVVTLFGERHAGRICASILHAIGLPWLVASSRDDYINIATRLANGTMELAQLRSSLRERMQSSPLCGGKEFARSVEDAYRDMWRNWCRTRSGSSAASH